MIIKRDKLEQLKKDLNRKEIMAIVGSRQVGKTTIIFINLIDIVQLK